MAGRNNKMTWLAAAVAIGSGCGIGVSRDFSATPPQQVIYDDMCGVQDYHDTLLLKKAEPPAVASTNELESTEGKRRSGGRTTFAFEAPFQLQALRRLLRENWKRLPDEIMKAERVHLDVRWSEKAGVRRVVTNEDAAIGTGPRDMKPLPYHVCLSELLFGAPLYQTRRQLLGLSPLGPTSPPAPASSPAPAPIPAAPVPTNVQPEGAPSNVQPEGAPSIVQPGSAPAAAY